jgi:hypothetical protein
MLTKTGKLQLVKLLTINYFFILALSILFSCKKPDIKEIVSEEATQTVQTTSSSCDLSVTTCEDCAFQETIEDDTTEYATILGGTYANPYSIQTMTQAYNNVHRTHVQSVSTTHY